MPDPSPSPNAPHDPAQALRAAAAGRRREARIAGPRDRAELERLAERDEWRADQFERAGEPEHAAQVQRIGDGAAWRAVCPCGWYGPRRYPADPSPIRDAESDAHAHNAAGRRPAGAPEPRPAGQTDQEPTT